MKSRGTHSEEIIYVADPPDCSSFLECRREEEELPHFPSVCATMMECPNGTVFDVDLNVCLPKGVGRCWLD